MKAPIEFYFDFASPYAYLAATQVEALAARLDRPLHWRAILMGAVLKVTGGVPNLAKPLQGDYLRRDVPRCARRLGVPLAHPLPSPFASLAASRAFYWLDAVGGEHSPVALAHAVFNAHWADGRDMAMPENVLDVAAGLGLDRAAVEAGLADPSVKERLRVETEAAIGRGVFGVPYFIVDDEPFWGADRMGELEAWVGGGW
ncbi:2-hydroxychromene-2-carboxylate isomerase [Niveispirillum fermenti]|uniref:2-hydroxychromene-2-carboxylate isomerase n=1 Tax=Niveispirillum fermenti TaxID=1233113 RepID=UPI003A880258